MTSDNLNNSRLLDVHVWSDYPEINYLVDTLWKTYFEPIDVSRRGPKPKAPKKVHLKVLLLDLYVCFLNDPRMYLAVHMSMSGWKANSRYNALHLSSQMIGIVRKLVDLEYLEFHKGYEGKLSRIRATDRLHYLFHSIAVPLPAISFHHSQEVLELRGDADTEISISKPKLEYKDTDATVKMRAVLLTYNDLLRRSHLDICSLEQPFIDRVITKGPRQGEQVRIHIDHRNIFVKRVFNKGSWELGGRFYGGWWQFIDKDLRSDIMINDKPTIEIDYKSMHIALLLAHIKQKSNYDPYSLSKSIFPNRNDLDQRSVVKQLVLMALNASDRKTAFSAFRGDQPTGHPAKKLTNVELSKLLDAFIEEYPDLAPFMCTGKGLQLMYIDSCIAEQVIDHFTNLSIPILCLHDSFIVPFDHVLELRVMMVKAGSSFTRRFMFTEKDGNGLDEWLSAYENTGQQPDFEPKQVVRCGGYMSRLDNT